MRIASDNKIQAYRYALEYSLYFIIMKNLNASLKTLSFFISIMFCAGFNCGYAQAGKNLAKDNEGHCGCPVINYVKGSPQYYPALSEYISYPAFQKFNLWKLPNGIKSYDMLFVKDDYSSGSGDNFFKGLSVISARDPIKIVHPEGTFTLNLTPCANQYHNYVLPISVSCKPSVADELRNFDYTKFENTTLGYVHLFMQMSGMRPDQMIRIAFKESARNYDLTGVNQAIAKINATYRTGIPLVTVKDYSDSLVISGVLDSLVSKKLRQEQVLTTGFILSEPGIHPPTYDERNRMEILFQRHVSSSAFVLFNPRNFLPDFNVELKSSQAVVEIASKILSPVVKSAKNPAPYDEIRIELCYTAVNNERMMRIDCMSDACLQPSVIAGTTLGIDFDAAFLFPEQLQTMDGYDCTPYPQFAKDTSAYKAYAPKKWTMYDTLFTHFTGLVIRDARFKLPYGKTNLLFKGKDVIINNRVIAGCLLADLSPDNTGKVLLNPANGISKTIAVTNLLLVLKKAGLNDFITKTDKKQLYIYFKKTAG